MRTSFLVFLGRVLLGWGASMSQRGLRLLLQHGAPSDMFAALRVSQEEYAAITGSVTPGVIQRSDTTPPEAKN